MTWKTFDFNTGTELNRSFLDRLQLFLERKEAQICHDTLHVMGGKDASLPSLLRLSELLSLLEARLQRQQLGPPSKLWKELAENWNGILWEYVEFLEGAIEELFAEASRIDLQVWSTEIMEVFLAVKGLLGRALDEVEGLVGGLNRALLQLRDKIDPKIWSVKRLFESSILDEELLKSIRQSRISLTNGSEKVIALYDNLNEMKEDVIASAVKIGTLPIFSTLEPETQQNFLELYELLKCYEKNRKLPLLEEKDLLMSLRKTTSKEQAFTIFRDYYHALHRELFHQSFDIKRNAALYAAPDMIRERVSQLKEIEGEVTLLAATIDHYREFLLATDPNPYVRARLGFTEWVLGPESKETKHLYKFGYSLESLNRLYGQLIESVQKGPVPYQDEQIEKILHEMGAPLLSEKVMVKHAENLITRFEEINELGSFEFSLIEKMGAWLGKALRFDWKHHVLQRYPEFHEIYAIHMGLAGTVDDQLHLNRLKKFRRLLAELREWISQRETAKHTRDIDLDINDIRGYLQEFLAHVQRSLGAEGESAVTRERMEKLFSRQLLEYRHLFGYFFHQFNDENVDESLIRSKCYFVDQYFEAIDKKLADKMSVA
jgi:hypothetical protein